MAHEVETMAYTGTVPWHDLGNTLTPNASLEDWQCEAGLNWTVSKRPVQYNGHYIDAQGMANNTLLPFKDKFVLARDTDDRPYAIVSERYKPVQPGQVLDFFNDLVSDFGMSLETAGSLRDGQRVWALAKTNDAHKVMGVDEVRGYLMLATSYDLTFSTLAYFTSIRVVCNNTLRQSFGDMQNKVKIPHFRDFNSDDVKEQLGVGRSQWAAFTGMLDTLAGIKLDETKAKEVLGKAFEITPFGAFDAPERAKEDQVKISHCDKIIALFNGKGIGSDVAGQSGWGLVNATTEYLQKHRRALNQGNRLDSAWFGESAEITQRAVDQTLLLAA